MKPARTARLAKNIISKSRSTASSVAQQHNFYETCPHAPAVVGSATVSDHINAETTQINQQPLVNTVHERVKPYSEVPGPKPLPILGNTWR